MSKEFERLKALLHCSEPADWEPQVDRGEAAKLAARWGWLFRRFERSAPNPLRCGGPNLVLGSDQVPQQRGDRLSPLYEAPDFRAQQASCNRSQKREIVHSATRISHAWIFRRRLERKICTSRKNAKVRALDYG